MIARLDWRTLKAEARRWDGRTVAVSGYMAPFAKAPGYAYFMLAEQPPECLCCPPGGPAAVLEVFARQPLPFVVKPVTLIGRLGCLEGDHCGYHYRLDDARPEGDALWLDGAARDIDRLWRASVHDVSRLGPASPLSLGRRDFMRGAMAASVSAWLGGAPAWAEGPALDARVGEVIGQSFAVDIHSHAGGRIRNMTPGANASEFNVAERMKAGRFGVATIAVVSDGPVIRRFGNRIAAFRDPGADECFRFVEHGLKVLERMRAEQGFVKILSPADVEQARQSGQPGLLFAVEGGDFIEGKPERVAWAHGLGLRHLQLVHYRINDLGDIQTQEPKHNGLTGLGAEVVAECNRLGIIVDVAHATTELTAKTAEISKAPIVLSHTSLTPRGGARPLSRLIGAEHAKLVAATGGMIGIWPSGFVFSDLDRYAEGIAAMAEAVGVDHVGIGTDMEGGIDEVFHSYADYPQLVDALLRRGFAPAEVAKIAGGNHARVFGRVAAVAGQQ